MLPVALSITATLGALVIWAGDVLTRRAMRRVYAQTLKGV